ncbi:metallothionein [Methylobacterium sp. JK268]
MSETADVEAVKCACENCVCVVPLATSVQHEGRAYCCDACATSHPDHAGCGHAGCGCHG